MEYCFYQVRFRHGIRAPGWSPLSRDISLSALSSLAKKKSGSSWSGSGCSDSKSAVIQRKEKPKKKGAARGLEAAAGCSWLRKVGDRG